MLCAKFGWKCPSGSEKEYFKNFSIMYIYYFAIIPTLRRTWPFIWKKNKNLNHLNTRMFCAKFDWKWPSGSREEDVFLLFHNYLPVEKGVALYLKKIEFPSSKNALCQVFLKLDQCFWRRFFFLKFSMYLYYFTSISPLRRAWSFIWTNLNPWVPFTQGCSVPSLVEIGSVVLDKKFSIFFYYLAIISPLGRT